MAFGAGGRASIGWWIWMNVGNDGMMEDTEMG
jgi:hypothetical protein